MRLEWDKTGERSYESGVDHGVLYPMDESGKYPKGVAWNGLTSVTESPSGAEPTDLWADNIKYASLRSAESFEGTIEAYTYPDEFNACDGFGELAEGVMIGQQSRQTFGFSYRTKVGNDANPEAGYKIHLIYGCTASPSERAYETINDSPDAITFSWDITTTPTPVTGHQPTSSVVIDTTKLSPEKLTELEKKLYGDATGEATLPLPDEVYSLLTSN